MKKILALLLALVMVIGLVACGGGGEKAPETQPKATEAPKVDTPVTEAPPAEEGGDEVVTDLPRNETLYFAGQQWGTVNSWNVIGTNQNNAMAIAGGASGYRTLMFETLFMYNPLDGGLYGLLAEDGYT